VRVQFGPSCARILGVEQLEDLVSKPLYIAAALLAAAGLCFVGLGMTRASSPHQPPGPSAEGTERPGQDDLLAVLQEQNASNQAAIGALTRQLATLRQAQQSGDASVADGKTLAPPEPMHDQASPPRQARSAEEKEVQRRSDFEAETVDPGWARQRESAISQFVSSTASRDTNLGLVSCRRTTCRIETTHPSAEARDAYLQNMGSHGPEHGSAWFRLTGDETSSFSVTLYLYADRDAQQQG
jgi:hypothetical protein